jgi:hypothetical protein
LLAVDVELALSLGLELLGPSVRLLQHARECKA